MFIGNGSYTLIIMILFKGVIKISEKFYTYTNLSADIECFCTHYPEHPVFSIGKSLSGHDIYAIKLGRGMRRLFITEQSI